MMSGQKLHWLDELDELPRGKVQYCERHNYWYWPPSCYMCAQEGRETQPSLRRF